MSVEGEVEARNDRGIKVGGEWLNVSKYGKALELPEVGAYIRAEIDKGGYLKSIELLEDSSPSSSPSARDQRITRLAVLKAAANFAADRTDIRSRDVLTIAESWLQWIEQDEPS